jgi:mono/diheme cytochrome c family protein
MYSSIAVLLLLFAAPALAQDPAPGRVLYETHCGGCHYERVHERTRSDVKGLADLRDTVPRWAAQTKHRFTLDEIESVVQYLNESHYRFGLPPDSAPRKRSAP